MPSVIRSRRVALPRLPYPSLVPGLETLWTPADDDDLAACLAAVGSDDLARALHAVEGAGAVERASDLALFSTFASRLAALGPPGASASPVARAESLRRVLGVEAGFRGDREDPHAARNSFLHSVLTRRRGLPILLSAVWIEVGRRAGLAVHGIGLPGHFVVRVGGAPGQVPERGIYADPYEGGDLRTTAELRRLVEEASSGRAEWDEGYLRPRGTLEIVERVLHNLGFSCRRDEDSRGLYRAAAFVAALRPDVPSALLRRGQAAEAAGAGALAAEDFEEVAERFPDSEESEAAELGLLRLREGPAAN